MGFLRLVARIVNWRGTGRAEPGSSSAGADFIGAALAALAWCLRGRLARLR
jgi:hypothetical protein